ncbi:MAG: molybdopterin molybdotransferase MoeA [Desulfotomaculaceae bacterium]|nr:molybdopterin molybdotransferase MoeA [Desulfotomaculaceae bacterium]
MLFNIKLEEAQDTLLSRTAPLPGETLPLLQALGRIAARDLFADSDLPSCPQAVVDGYAVGAYDKHARNSYVITERLQPGAIASLPLGPGQAAGVATGSELPAGTVAVVAHETTRLEGERVILLEEILPGDNIRQPGEAFHSGELLVSRGASLSPGRISVLAAFGKHKVTVFRRPRVAVLSLGGGIVSYHATPQPGQRRDSNGPLLAALALQDGAQVTKVEVTGDENASTLKEHLENLLCQADLLITTGGAASGVYDQAIHMLKHIGAQLLFWGVKIKPGSHSGAAIGNDKLMIALSGNPAACAAGYHLLAAPVLRALQGLEPYPQLISATCTNSYIKEGGPRRFLQGVAVCDHKGWSVTILPGQKSSMLQALTQSNALIDLPAGCPPVEKGQNVPIVLLHGK